MHHSSQQWSARYPVSPEVLHFKHLSCWGFFCSTLPELACIFFGTISSHSIVVVSSLGRKKFPYLYLPSHLHSMQLSSGGHVMCMILLHEGVFFGPHPESWFLFSKARSSNLLRTSVGGGKVSATSFLGGAKVG